MTIRRLLKFVGILLLFEPGLAHAEVTVRLVAADRAEKPLVSDLVDFRRSPDGGLIAVQWVSNMIADGKPLFPVQEDESAAPFAPDDPGRLRDTVDIDDLLSELQEETTEPEKPRALDAVDPQYKDAELYDGIAIGPVRRRRSAGTVAAARTVVIAPGDVRIKATSEKVDVPCYPLTITAVRADSGERLAFIPRLRFGRFDLLADCLYEYSPDMPRGDVMASARGDNVGRMGWLKATRGGRRLFRRLTVYLPASGKMPYHINGQAFRLDNKGVRLEKAGSRHDAAKVRREAPFHLRLSLPGEERPAPSTPKLVAIAGEGDIAIRPGPSVELYQINLPKTFAARLTPRTRLPESRQGETITLRFQRDADDWVAEYDGATSGVYGLVLDTKEPTELPVVIATAKTVGSVSLLTYHNRNDYLRGETADVCLLARAVKAFENVPASLTIRHESGESKDLAQVKLTCSAGGSRSLFVPIDTSGLRLGTYAVTLAVPDDSLLTYATQFTVHAAVPQSTFARYSWFSASFSGPMKAGDKMLANILLSQKPTAQLTTDELKRYTRQPVFPAEFRTSFAHAPLFPAPETTIAYDKGTEREMAVAMRLGLRYCPDYGWGMNGQESAWNPKHTLPQELDRIRRLCSQVTQRHRDFGNFGGLHLNWYPCYRSHFEQHPPTDGNAGPRSALLQKEIAQVYAETPADRQSKTPGLDRAVRAHKYRVGAMARAYEAWTETARSLSAGIVTRSVSEERDVKPSLADVSGYSKSAEFKPGFDSPVYTSFPASSWFSQRNYYPSTYYSTLPVAAVHAYTDYGFSPFQPLWAVDHWAAGVGDKPVWATTMSNGRDIMLRHALLLAGRGADGIDINGSDDRTAAVISDFLASYGSFFSTLTPHSDVAIITSLRQQFSSKDLSGQWMGYSGGKYYNLYTKLWYARRPAAMLPEEDVTLDRLQKYKAVFLVGQKVRLPETAMSALDDYAASGGRIFRDADTADIYPGTTYALNAAKKTAWEHGKYKQTRDVHFVGTQSGYESVADSLEKLLSQLPPPKVHSPRHDVMLATLRVRRGSLHVRRGSPDPAGTATEGLPEAGRNVASGDLRSGEVRGQETRAQQTRAQQINGPQVFFAVNDRRMPPGIYHPWNFWSASIMSAQSTLTFDKPYVLYDVLEGGREIVPEKVGERYVVPVSFNSCAGRVFVAVESPIRKVQLQTVAETAGGEVPIEVHVLDDQEKPFSDPLPGEIQVIDDRGQIVQTIYRAIGPGRKVVVNIPRLAEPGEWKISARELASGRTATATVRKIDSSSVDAKASLVLMPRPDDVGDFICSTRLTATQRGARRDPLRRALPVGSRLNENPLLILLDDRQLSKHGQPLRQLADQLAERLQTAESTVEVRVIASDEIVEVPQRWRLTAHDQAYMAEAKAGKRILAAGSLTPRHFRTTSGAAGRLDVLHPDSGWEEPGARYRIFHDVILLGSAADNRFLDDLHATVGMRADDALPAPGSALVQVVYDAFTAGHDCLSIQAHDLEGIRRGVEAIVTRRVSEAEHEPRPNSSPAAADLQLTLRVTRGDEIRPLPNPIRDVFGATVHPTVFTADGGLFVAAGTEAANYFLFDADGNLKRKWLGKYGIDLPDQGTEGRESRSGFWTRDWSRLVGIRNVVVRTDTDFQPLWTMQSPRYRLGLRGWRHPGRRTIVDPKTDHLFFAGNSRLSRVTPDGKVVWRYEDLGTNHDVRSFRFSRDFMLHGISDDGRFVLAAAFGIEPYAGFISHFIRPAVILFDAETGRIVWEKQDILIDHSACGFVAEDRIVIADATPDRKRVMLFDMSGRELWSRRRPQGTSRAALSPDGRWLVVQPEAERGANFQTINPPRGLEAIPVNAGQTKPFPLDADVHAWQTVKSTGQVLVSTTDGRLQCFQPDTTLVWQRQFGGPVHILVAPDGKQIAVGGQNGLLRWLDQDGDEIRQTDLMAHNIVTDDEQFVRDYTYSPTNLPILDPLPAPPPRIDRRHGKVVRFSANLIAKMPGSPLTGTETLRARANKGGTYVMSLTQRAEGARFPDAAERLTVEVRYAGRRESLFAAPVSLSASWEERTFAWKLSKGRPITISLTYNGDQSGVDIRDVAVFKVSYPSRNVLAQRLPDEFDADEPAVEEDALELLLDDTKYTPPSVNFFIPNDVNLTARSRGAKPFKPVILYTTPFDGVLSGQQTSWLGKPATGSTHAQLQLKFKTPIGLTALAVHEDPSAGYTDTYALFCRNADTGQWRQVGHVAGNRNQSNLFTFPPIRTDALTYLWLKSADRHARIAEMEGFRPDE